MGNEWKETLLEDISEEITVGFVGSMASEYVEDGIPFFRSKNISPYNILWDDMKYISHEFHKKIKKSILRPGDVVIVRTGKPGTSSIIPDTIKEANCSDLVIVRPGPNLNKKFLAYYLNSAAINHINAHLVGAVQQHFNVGAAKKLSIPLPPLPEQKAIAHILGSLDDKIELNRKMNATLESMAQALFKSWFVDFDPVIDNALAAGNPIPDALRAKAEVRKALGVGSSCSQHRATAEQELGTPSTSSQFHHLFPDSFQPSEEMDWIPEGWEVKALRAITSKISKGTTPRKSETAEALDPETVPFLKVRDITDKGNFKESDFDLIPRSIHESSLKRSILSGGDVLFSIAGTIGRVTYVPSELHDSNINQAIAFIRPNGAINTMFILEHLRGSFIQDRIHSRVVQAVQANISLTEIGDLPVPISSPEIHDAWQENTADIYQKIATLKLLNRSLTKLRDTLLPKLISGELRIEDAEKMVGDVAG